MLLDQNMSGHEPTPLMGDENSRPRVSPHELRFAEQNMLRKQSYIQRSCGHRTTATDSGLSRVFNSPFWTLEVCVVVGAPEQVAVAINYSPTCREQIENTSSLCPHPHRGSKPRGSNKL